MIFECRGCRYDAANLNLALEHCDETGHTLEAENKDGNTITVSAE